MLNDYLLLNNFSNTIYNKYKDLPIYDYHCHLSPREIYEDNVFSDIGEMFLGADHYKWRLMRRCNVDEKYITGNASFKEKFLKYAKVLETAAMSPLYYWTHMELSIYFGIDEFLNSQNAEAIYEKCNSIIQEKQLSPQKLIKQSNVKYIATTDNISDNLHYHSEIAKTVKDFKVCPSFRTDAILNIYSKDYYSELDKLSSSSETGINSINDFKSAILKRIDYFKLNGCKFSDVGLPYFPNKIYNDKEAENVFEKIIRKENVNIDDYLGFLGNMYVFLAEAYQKNNMVMQLHLGVKRNSNTILYNMSGADCGVDCMGESISASDIINLLDTVNVKSGLPKTVIYSLKNDLYTLLCNISSSFNDCITGAAWWFCDNKRGIEEQIMTLCEQGHIGEFLGMLTDSRSFLSYARHDFFRRLFCNIIGDLVEKGEFDSDYAGKLIKNVFTDNIKKLIEG